VNQLSFVLRKQLLKAGGRILERRARARLQQNEGLWSTLQKYLEGTQSTGCQHTDYEALYEYVRREKPREILECGTGVSTVVIAHALMENAEEDRISGRVTSMEEIESWFEMAAGLLPDSLREYVDLVLSPTIEDGYVVFRGVRYRDVPDRRYEFVFTDGPTTAAPSDGTRCANFDYLHIVRRADHPVFGIIDKRLSTCYVLQKVFGDNFRYDPYRELGYVGPCTRNDMRTITRSSSIALAHSKRLLRRTRFHLVTEPPP
jgi:predicted O-methyltransferase YrrM